MQFTLDQLFIHDKLDGMNKNEMHANTTNVRIYFEVTAPS